jgi:hypothetical protein
MIEPKEEDEDGRSLCRFYDRDKSWSIVELPLKKYSHIEDVIQFNERLFYTVSGSGHSRCNIYAYNLSNLFSPECYLVETCFDFEPLSSLGQRMRSWYGKRYYLVESLGDLLWVCRFFTQNECQRKICIFLWC